MKPAAAAFAVLLLAACARTEDASVSPPEGNEAVERVREEGADEREPALGEWRRAFQDEQPSLEFGPAGTAPVLTILCGERGGLLIQRAGAPAPGAAPTLSITVAGQGRQLPMAPVAGATPVQRASIPAGDTLIQQLGAASAPIQLRFGDGTPLVLPHSPMIAAFAQGCASGFTRERAEEPAGNNVQAPAATEETNAASAR